MVLHWLLGRTIYIPLPIDSAHPHWAATFVMARIYGCRFLLWLYKVFKACYRLITGTSELFRICDGAVRRAEREREEKEIEMQELADAGDTEEKRALLTESKEEELASYINPTLIYRIEAFFQEIYILFIADRALLYSTALTKVRRRLESRDNTLEEPLTIILTKKRFPNNGSPTTPQALVLRQCITTISASYKLVHELNARASTPFDPTNRAHERRLQELWNLLMPHEKLTSRYTQQWKTIGFQGQDPATDFRGMGMLGLDCLHYHAKTHPESAAHVLEISHHSTAWFSMAIVGINITDFALQLVRTRQLQYFLYKYGTTKTMFEEFYCYMFDEFAKYWSSQPALTPMDFGRIFDQFQGRIQVELNTHKETVLDTSSLSNKKTR